MKITASLVAVGLGLLVGSGVRAEVPQFRDLLNGRDLTGWVNVNTAGGDVLLRELLIGFGAAGYVALFEIEDAQTVTVLAVRHQREDDYR